MSFNKSPLAFDDVREILDRALAAPKGIRIPCGSRGKAVVTRSRYNYFRKMDRKSNAETYASDHPLHAKSIYDRLEMHIPPKGDPNEQYLYIQKRSSEGVTIEEI